MNEKHSLKTFMLAVLEGLLAAAWPVAKSCAAQCDEEDKRP